MIFHCILLNLLFQTMKEFYFLSLYGMVTPDFGQFLVFKIFAFCHSQRAQTWLFLDFLHVGSLLTCMNTCMLFVLRACLIYFSGKLHAYSTRYHKSLPKCHSLGYVQGYQTLGTVLDQSDSLFIPSVPTQPGMHCNSKMYSAFHYSPGFLATSLLLLGAMISTKSHLGHN